MTQRNLHFSLRRALVSTSILCGAIASHATVLTFDDLSVGPVPANYGGLEWTQSPGSWDAVPSYYPYVAHSGSMDADLSEFVQESGTFIDFPTPSQFQGAWFSGGYGIDVGFDLWRNGQLVATTSWLTLSPVPTFLSSGYLGVVDAVSVKSPGEYGYLAMDDFTFTTLVPEPVEAALTLAGLGALALARKRFV